MDEQEILSSLKDYVARHQNPKQKEPLISRPEDRPLDLANIPVLTSELVAAQKEIGTLNPRRPGLHNDLAQAAKKMVQRSLSWYTRSLEVFHGRVVLAIQEQGNAIQSIASSIEGLKVSANALFAECARNTEPAVQEQLAPYVIFFRDLSPVVDLGCGRGEFLVLLKEHCISSYGVDSDPAACEGTRRKSVEVVQDDILQHLRSLPDRSLGGVFSSRVIEYLAPHLQIELISLCSSKLKPGATLVFETANPECRPAFGRTYNVDRTHQHPIPPVLLKSILESHDFRDIGINVLAPVEIRADQFGQPRGSAVDPIRIFERPSACLAGSPAYAVIGRRN